MQHDTLAMSEPEYRLRRGVGSISALDGESPPIFSKVVIVYNRRPLPQFAVYERHINQDIQNTSVLASVHLACQHHRVLRRDILAPLLSSYFAAPGALGPLYRGVLRPLRPALPPSMLLLVVLFVLIARFTPLRAGSFA